MADISDVSVSEIKEIHEALDALSCKTFSPSIFDLKLIDVQLVSRHVFCTKNQAEKEETQNVHMMESRRARGYVK